MNITEVRIKLMDDPSDRLRAFCSITFDDCFVVRDLKIIEGSNGPFVAMPSRKLTSHCPQCGCKNHLRASYCNQCGLRQKEDLGFKDQGGRAKLYADIAHPINSKCREMIQHRVIEEFSSEIELAKEPGYVSCYDDFYEDEAGCADARETPSVKTSSINRSADIAQVQPAATEPRPPHKMPAKHTSSSTLSETRKDRFGDGIF